MVYNTYYISLIYHKKNSKIDTISVDIWFDLISNQINDIKLAWEGKEVFTQQNGGVLLLHKEKKNGRRRQYEWIVTLQLLNEQRKKISMYPFRQATQR